MPKGPKSQKRPAGVIGNAPDRVGRRRTKGEKQLQAESISLTPVFPQIRSYEKGSPPFGSDPPLASAPWPDHLPVFFTVSTIAVFERAIATETGINRPLLSIPPLYPLHWITPFSGRRRRPPLRSNLALPRAFRSLGQSRGGPRVAHGTISLTPNREQKKNIAGRSCCEATTFRSRAWAPRV